MKIYFLFEYADHDAGGGFTDLLTTSTDLNTVLQIPEYIYVSREVWVLEVGNIMPVMLCHWSGNPYGWYKPHSWDKFIVESEQY